MTAFVFIFVYYLVNKYSSILAFDVIAFFVALTIGLILKLLSLRLPAHQDTS